MGIRTWHKPLLFLTGLMTATLLLSVGGLLFDDRILRGEPIWLKPFKFSVSIGLYALTLAWLVSLLRKGKKVAWWMGTISVVMMVVEMAAIVTQVLRGQPSHFNNVPGFDSLAFDVMAYAIITLWVANLVIAVIVLRQRFVDGPMLWAIRLSLLLALAGMAVAFLMPPPSQDQLELLRHGAELPIIGGHTVGAPDGGPSMPITAWSTTAGDLRIPHFVGIHALQVLPLLALFFSRRFADRSEQMRTRLVFVSSAAYLGLFGLTLWQALRGQPLIYPDALTLLALAVVVVGTVAATAVVIRNSKARVLV